MSLASVRGAIAAYLNAGVNNTIPGLNQVYRAQPTFIDPTKWWQLPPELGAGTVGYLHLAKVDEDRVDFPAVDGHKLVAYIVVLVLIYRYQIPSGTQAMPYEGDEWIDGQDETVEAIKAWIRADPNLGTAQVRLFSNPPAPGVIYAQYPGAIWEAGQDKGDLSMTADPPVRDEEGGEVLSFQILEFHAYEAITA